MTILSQEAVWMVPLLAVLAVYWLYSLASPWRSLIGWVVALSVQLNVSWIPDFRPAVSDLFVPALAMGVLLEAAHRPRRSQVADGGLGRAVLLFTALFLVVGNVVTLIRLGFIPRWTLLNKDAGLIDLVVCFFCIVRLLDSRERLHAMIRVFVLSGSALNVIALVGGVAGYVFGVPNMMMRDNWTLRLVGYMINPGSYGGFVLCVLMMQLALFLGGSKILPLSRWVQVLNIALLSVAAMITLSRSTTLGVTAGMIAMLYFYRIRAGMRLVALGLLAFIGFVAIVNWYAASHEITAAFWGNMFSTRTLLERVNANEVGLGMVLDNPILVITGTGIGSFLVYAQETLGAPLIIHNDYVWMLVEGGIWGIGCFLLIIVTSLRSCLRVARFVVAESPVAIGVACALIGTLVWMLGTEGLWHRHVWFLLALSEVCFRVVYTEFRTNVNRTYQSATTVRVGAPA